jgi:hypothetical protein
MLNANKRFASFIIGIIIGLASLSIYAENGQSPGLAPMQLDGQFQGPFHDTVIQRWRDPQTGVLCYLFIPLRVENQRTPSGGYAYGSNTLGSMSCLVQPTKQK